MLGFKDFEYTLFNADSGAAETTFNLGREITITYINKSKHDLPRLVFEMLSEVATREVAISTLSKNSFYFEINYYIDDKENSEIYKFLSTPQTYKKVFNV